MTDIVQDQTLGAADHNLLFVSTKVKLEFTNAGVRRHPDRIAAKLHKQAISNMLMDMVQKLHYGSAVAHHEDVVLGFYSRQQFFGDELFDPSPHVLSGFSARRREVLQSVSDEAVLLGHFAEILDGLALRFRSERHFAEGFAEDGFAETAFGRR